MPFELFTKQVAATSGRPFISLQKRGIFGFNLAAYEALGEPKAVALLFDAERKIVGFRPADPAEAHAYALRGGANDNSYVVSGMQFVRHYGIPNEVGQRWPAFKEGDLLCIDISRAPTTTRATLHGSAHRTIT